MKPVNLNDLAERIGSWSEALWRTLPDGMGGFGNSGGVPVNLLSSTDVAWIGHALGRDEAAGPKRNAWVRFLQTRQDARTGRLQYEPHANTRLSAGHAFWHTVRALNILGAGLVHYPRYLTEAATVGGLEAFFDAVDWSAPQSNHHEVLGLSPLLASLGDEQWTDTFYRKLAEQQDARTGTWPAGRPINISRTYAYSVLHRAAGRLPPMGERIVDAILATQRGDGQWPGSGFHTMDSAYLLVRLAPAIAYRQADARDALARLASSMNALAESRLEETLRDTHGTLAVVQTFSLLQEAFPEAYAGDPPWRFDWEDARLYYCQVIADGPPGR